MRKDWLQDAFYFLTLDFSLYNEPRRELIELYIRKNQKELHYEVSVVCVVALFRASL